MRKSFSTLLLTALFLAFGAVFGTHAAEPDRFAEARQYYIESGVEGFKTGVRIGGGGELTPEKIASARRAIGEWLDKDMIPFLRQNDILEEWVKMQLDADVRKANKRSAEAKSVDELMQIMRELDPLLKTRYPAAYAKLSSPEGVQLMQKLQVNLMKAMRQ